ncbi:hypothetical protein [Melghirimyces algeriensis]|nr:hypothetical protein [Melghirimyces algeriensis]
MEKWVQLLVATVSFLRLLLELPQMMNKWNGWYRKKRYSKRRNSR